MKLLWLVLAAACVAAPLAAQNGAQEDCLEKLAARLDRGEWVPLSACAPQLVGALAGRVSAARQDADPNRLALLAEYAAYIRDPSILSAAWALIDDRSAPAAARNLGLVLALNAHQRGLVPSGVHSYLRLLTEAVPSACSLTATASAQYWVENALPADELPQTLGRARAVLGEATAPETTRRLAACIVQNLIHEVEPDLAAVTVSYVCGRIYQLRNGTDRYLTLNWIVEGSDEVSGATLAPNSERRIDTPDSGVLKLMYVDPRTRTERVIATVTATPHPCP